jgi:hypothetical protein
MAAITISPGIALSVANVAIFFLDWRLKTASGDFFGTYISLCKFIDNQLCTVTKINKLLMIDFRKCRVFPVPNSSLEFSKNRKKRFVTIHSSSTFAD